MNVYTQRAQQKSDNSPDCMYVCVSEKCTLYAHDLIRVINFIPQREKRSKLR